LPELVRTFDLDFGDACRAVGRRGDRRRVDLRAVLAIRREARLIDFRFVAMKSSRLGKLAKLVPQVGVSTERGAVVAGVQPADLEVMQPTRLPLKFLLRRRALSVVDHFVYRGGKLIHPGARNDDRVAATVRFLGDAKEFAAVVLTKLDVKMLTLDLQLPRFDEIIHVCKNRGV
jgi:hypothetical protein